MAKATPCHHFFFVLAINPINHIIAKATSQGPLHPLCGRTSVACTSLNVVDAAVFVALIKENINFLDSTLATLGDATSLKAKLSKTPRGT
jgi:hypothetical protein